MKEYQQIPILMYHHISQGQATNPWTVSWPVFEAQVKALKSWGYHTVTFKELLMHFKAGQQLPSRPVILTFDDAFAELYQNVFPFLFEQDFTGTIFVPTDRLGKTNDWDKGKGYPVLKLLNPKQLRELCGHGAEAGSHGRTHSSFASLTVKKLRQELQGSKKKLEKITAQPVLALAYPYGHWDELVMTLAQEAGYQAGCVIDSPAKDQRDHPFLMRRVFVKPTDGLLALRRKISQWYLWWRGIKGH